VVWTALKSDVAHRSGDEKERQAADDHMGLMTPVLKGVLTDVGFANAVQAQQMFGGHGYIVENGMEQFVRDARIAMIYEGANGIQALDLVGRKLPRDGGRAMMRVLRRGRRVHAKENAGNEAMKPVVAPLSAALQHLAAGDDVADAERDAEAGQCRCGPRPITCISSAWSLGYMWARMAKVAQDKRRFPMAAAGRAARPSS
jgi:acyl-CoA dehydrogenase